MSEADSVQETGKSTAVDATQQISAVALMNAGAANAMQVGPRPTFRPPSLRSDELAVPSVSLAPGNIEGLPDYDDTSKEWVGEAVTAMSELHQGVQRIIDARQASKRNPSWTEAQQVLQVDVFASKITSTTLPKVDAALKLLSARITDTQNRLSQPLDVAVASPVASEVREYARSLSATKRNELMADLIAKGDSKSLGALLGSGVPGFLSGLSDAQVKVYTEMHNRKAQPLLAQKLSLLKAAHEKLANAGSLFIVQAERASGVKQAVIAKLKAAQSKAEAAFR